jgi:hypothetical protein
VSTAIEQAVLDHAPAHSVTGYCGLSMSCACVGCKSLRAREVWQRHGLLTSHDRVLRLDEATADRRVELSDERSRLLERSRGPNRAGSQIETLSIVFRRGEMIHHPNGSIGHFAPSKIMLGLTTVRINLNYLDLTAMGVTASALAWK